MKLNAIMIVLTRERQSEIWHRNRRQCDDKQVTMLLALRIKKRAIVKKYRNAIQEAGIGKETDFPLELSEGSRPCQYLILV